jgi:N-acetylglucosamine-6-phosphate deacetylase
VTTTILAARGVCPPGPPAPGWVAAEHGRVVDLGSGLPPPGAVDLGDVVLAPAFVDLQLNGVGDVDLATADPLGWHAVGDRLARRGVAAYLATFVSAPLDAYDAMLDRLDAATTAATAGAAPLGAHLEGPFLGAAPGAHPPALLRPADAEWLVHLLDAHPGLIRMVTLAPEADPGLAATRALAERGVVVAIGHSTATEAEARAAADAGASVVTHLFNAMSPLRHREPGIVGAALDDPRLTPTMIGDLVHVHPTAVRVAFAARPSLILVSDSVSTNDAMRPLDGAARLADGRLAGAVALLDDAVANVVGLGIPIEHAVRAASTRPADLLGLPDRGRLAVGARADFVALDPQTGMRQASWLAGDAIS